MDALCHTRRMTKSISIRVDDALIESVDQVRRREGRERSDVVREALQLWLKNRKIAAQTRAHRKGYSRQPVSDGEFSVVLGAQQWPK